MRFIQFDDGSSGIGEELRKVLGAFVLRRRMRIDEAINILSSRVYAEVEVALSRNIRVASQFLRFFDVGSVTSGSGHGGNTLHIGAAVPAKPWLFAKLSIQRGFKFAEVCLTLQLANPTGIHA